MVWRLTDWRVEVAKWFMLSRPEGHRWPRSGTSNGWRDTYVMVVRSEKPIDFLDLGDLRSLDRFEPFVPI